MLEIFSEPASLVRLGEILISLAIFQQNLEQFFILKWMREKNLNSGLKLHVQQILTITQLLLCLGLIFSSQVFVLAALLILFLQNAFFWRGPFNGGSDSMTALVLMAVFVWRLGEVWVPVKFGGSLAMGYVGLQVLLSYVIAGLVKLKHSSWRRGEALGQILQTTVYGKMELSPVFSIPAVSWLLIFFELSIIGALVFAKSNVLYLLMWLSIALVFHLLNAWFLGLNRFVLAWLAAYPALIWLLKLT